MVRNSIQTTASFVVVVLIFIPLPIIQTAAPSSSNIIEVYWNKKNSHNVKFIQFNMDKEYSALTMYRYVEYNHPMIIINNISINSIKRINLAVNIILLSSLQNWIEWNKNKWIWRRNEAPIQCLPTIYKQIHSYMYMMCSVYNRTPYV